MALMYGFRSLIDIQWESTYGTAPAGNWIRVPVLSLDPGVDQPWEEMDIFSLAPTGRDEAAPMRGLLTVEPTIEVPVDLNHFGHWLRLIFGAPTTSGTTDRTHTFNSGGTLSTGLHLQHHNSDLSANPFMLLRGLRGDTLEMSFRFGEPLQTARLGLVGLNAARAGSTAAGTPTTQTFVPFSGAVGTAVRNGSNLGRVTGATIRYSNGLEKLREANRASAAITEAAPGQTEVTGTIDLRMDDATLLADSEGASAVDLTFGYSIAANQYLTFQLYDVYLNRLLPPVRGRAGIQATFAYRAVWDSSATRSMQVILANQVTGY